MLTRIQANELKAMIDRFTEIAETEKDIELNLKTHSIRKNKNENIKFPKV